MSRSPHTPGHGGGVPVRFRRVLVILLGGILLGGCTLVPTDAAPQSVPARDVPSGLLSGQPVERTAPVTLYFRTSEGDIVARATTLDAPVGLRIVLSALAAAPPGLQTDVPGDLTILRGIIHGSTTEITVANDDSPVMSREGLEQIRRTCAALYGTSTLQVTSAATQRTYVADGTPAGR